jgi:hypothetical protein|tara:strand:+ start:227 stop:436 length:210 start_codon:yes stop_codon:yes gene_type:complete
MTKCIEPSDPRYFTVTSDEPYDRHDYKVIRKDGKTVVVNSWESAREIWWNTPSNTLSHIEILDKKKGFK